METNWYVLTGASRIGKTKLLEYLSFLGYRTCPEVARIYIDNELSKGTTMDEIAANNAEIFQKKVVQLQFEVENRLNEKDLIFLDRSIVDSIAYAKIYNRDISQEMQQGIIRRYKKVFLLDQLYSYYTDYIPYEDKEQLRRTHKVFEQTYTELGYDIIRVPVASIEERANFILEYVREFEKQSTTENRKLSLPQSRFIHVPQNIRTKLDTYEKKGI